MILKRTMSAVIAVAAAASTMVCFAVSANAATETTLTLNPSIVGEMAYQGNAGGNKTLISVDNSALSSAVEGDSIVIEFTVEVEENGVAYVQTRSGEEYGTCYTFQEGEYIAAQSYRNFSDSHRLKDSEGNSSCPANTPINVTITMPLNSGGNIVSGNVVSCTATYEENGETVTLSRSEYPDRDLGGMMLTGLEVWSREQGNPLETELTPRGSISAGSVKFVTADPETPEDPDVTMADAYEFDIDQTLAHTDAKGFTVTVNGKEGEAANVEWYASINSGETWKYLDTDETTISGEGKAMFGAILYDIPEDVETSNVVAGYVIK